MSEKTKVKTLYKTNNFRENDFVFKVESTEDTFKSLGDDFIYLDIAKEDNDDIFWLKGIFPANSAIL